MGHSENRTILEICTEKGQEYAQEVGCALGNLKHGLYRVLEVGVELENSENRRANKIKEIEDNITQTREKLKTSEDIIQSTKDELEKFKKERDKHSSAIKRKDSEIEHNQDKLKQGVGATRRDNFEYNFMRIIFVAITIGLFAIYFFFWYNSLFSSQSNEYTSIIDSKFLMPAFKEGDVFGIIVSIVLTAFPFGLSFLFHSKSTKSENSNNFWIKCLNVFKSKIGHYFALLLALSIDIFLAYRIVEHVFNTKKFMGAAPDVNFSMDICLNDVSFWLLLSISFLAYFIWGIFYFKLKVLKKPDEHIESIINGLKEDKISISNDLDDCNSNIKTQEEKQKEEIINIADFKKVLDANEENLNKIKITPITTKLDLKMKASSFYVGFIKAYRNNSPKGKSEDELENEMRGKDSVVDAFVSEVEQSGKYLFV